MNELFWYLASPYSHPDWKVRQSRFYQVRDIEAKLVNLGLMIYSPISVTHPQAVNHNLPTHYEFWQAQDEAMISESLGVIVAKMEGWEESNGISQELKFARSIGKPILFYEVG